MRSRFAVRPVSLVTTVTLCLNLGSCGVSTITPEHRLPSVPSLPREGNPDPIQVPIEVPVGSACEYWKDLADASADGETSERFAVFRIFEEIEAQKGVLVGRHALEHVPQLLFGLSAEYNNGKKPIDPPNLDEFMDLAKAMKESGDISGTDYFFLKLLRALGAKKKLISLRNEAIQKKVEAQLPGVMSGEPAPISQAKLVVDLLNAAKKEKLTESDLPALWPLTKATPLFVSLNWSLRRQDLAKSLAILSRDVDPTNFAETSCRFAILERVTAQLIAVKGMHGAPQLTERGLLPAVSNQEVAKYDEEEINGSFNEVVDREWIEGQMANPSARPNEASTTRDFIESLRFVMTLTAHRSPTVWSLPDETPGPGTLKISSSLLQLGFGLFGVGAQVLSAEEFHVADDNRITLREDSADNLALLGHAALEVEDAYKNLDEATAVDRAVLSNEQIDSFLAPYPVGVVPQFEMLRNGIVLEGLARIDEGRDSPALRSLLREIGHRIGNDRLIQIP